MAKVVVDVELKYKEAQAEIEGLNKQINKLEKDVVKSNQETAKSLKGVEKSSKATAKGVKGIGNALKAAGIGLAIAAFTKLVEVFNQNQKVTDTFSTTFEALSLAFNDFFNFLDKNVGTVISYFQAIFNDPQQSLKDLGKAIKENIIERINSSLEVLGYLGDAIVKVFTGDWEGAMESAKSAGKEFVDVVTGVDDSFNKVSEVLPGVVESITNYATSTIKAAKNTVELNKQAELSAVINQGLIEKYDRQAELQRQIRDDESKTIEERIAANEKLGEILDEQSEKMLENVDIQIAAAQAEYNKNQNQENAIALQEALNEKAAVQAQIEGFRSEQLININSLQREQEDLKKEADEQEIERKERLLELQEQERQGIYDAMDAVASAAGAESKIAKALFILKTGMMIKEQIIRAKATLAQIATTASNAGVDSAAGLMKAAAAAPPPANVPLIATFATQAAGIAIGIAAAVNAAKSTISSVGGAGAGAGGSVRASAPAPTPPSFNVVGAAPENQLAQAIGDQQQKPIQAFVVGQEVTTQQSLDRNIINNASLG